MIQRWALSLSLKSLQIGSRTQPRKSWMSTTPSGLPHRMEGTCLIIEETCWPWEAQTHLSILTQVSNKSNACLMQEVQRSMWKDLLSSLWKKRKSSKVEESSNALREKLRSIKARDSKKTSSLRVTIKTQRMPRRLTFNLKTQTHSTTVCRITNNLCQSRLKLDLKRRSRCLIRIMDLKQM